MASRYSTQQVLDLFFDNDVNDEEDSEDEFEGYIDDNEIGRITYDNQCDVVEVDGKCIDDIGREDDDGENLDEDEEFHVINNGNVVTSLPEFQDPVGGTKDMSNKTPIEFFNLMVTDDILQNIVDQTNIYAEQYLEKREELPKQSRVHVWKKKIFSVSELLQFLGLIFTMGLIKYTKLEDYWATSWPFHIHTFSNIMSRDRFSVILKFLHVNDSFKFIQKGLPGYDPLYKVRPMLDPILHNFRSNFNLSRELSVDEQMVSFKGRLSFLQYLPKKPTKWGMKAFVLADSKSGYTYNWKLYTGKDDSLDTTNRTVTHAIVMDLVEGLDFKGHNIYMDNYYSSPSLFSDLYKHGFGACGTVGINRTGMPKEWKKK